MSVVYPARSFEAMNRKQAIATCYALEDMRDKALATLARVEKVCDDADAFGDELEVTDIRYALLGPAK